MFSFAGTYKSCLTLQLTVTFCVVYYVNASVGRHFDVPSQSDKAEAAKIFSVPDFVGDACKAIASRIRGAVAAVQFDDFHKVR